MLAGGALFAAAILALVISNTALNQYYHHFLDIIFSIRLGNAELTKPVILWINDGLMAVFFLLVGLELKREIVSGELREYDRAILPLGGALGGMVVPLLVYWFIAGNHSDIAHGWAIPMATDIAFALGVLSLFGDRVPPSLKIFLMTLAIVDDLGAIVIIALFHTADLSVSAFMLAAICLLLLIVLNRLRVSNLSVYLLIGLVMWVCVLKSGFHATMAGVLLALTIPVEGKNGEKLLENLEDDLHTMVSFIILPLFAFANAGVPLGGMTWSDLNHPLLYAIVFGLVVGKIVGIVIFTQAVKVLFKIESSFTFLQLIGVAALCGIGFTMSLFIAGLSFTETEQLLNISRLAILTASVIAMTVGILVLTLSFRCANKE